MEATAVSMQEIRGDVSRLDSNQETQKKYLIKELVRVEEIAQSAMAKSQGVQEQVDSMREQTRMISESMTLMHRHSEELTRGLTDVLQKFNDLHFEMPNKFDDWLTVRLGQAGGGASTISGEDLQGHRNDQLQIPSAPPLMILKDSAAPTQNGNGKQCQTDPPTEGMATLPPVKTASPPPHSSSSPSRPSSTEVYRTYLVPQSSQDDLLSELEPKSEIGGVEGNDLGIYSAEVVPSGNESAGGAVLVGDLQS